MYKKSLGALLLIPILLSSSISITAFVTPDKTFIADDNNLYEFTAKIDAPLSWLEDERYVVEVNITLTKSPDNGSGLRVIYIIFTLSGDVGGSETPLNESDFLSVNEEIRVKNEEQSYQKALRTPSLVDNFNLNVTIGAVVTGNDTSQDPANPRKYTYLFTEDLSVDRQRAQGLVDLYGFPPGSFFFGWLPIVGVFTLVILTPTFTALSFQAKDKLTERKEKSKAKMDVDETNTSEANESKEVEVEQK